MIDLDALAQAASYLDPLPVSVTRLAGMVCDEVPDLGDVTEVVERDAALTATLLRVANSSWSASQSEITTVRDSVIRLGAGPVLSIALGSNVRDRLSGAIPEYGLDEGVLWKHSVAASLAAEAVSRATPLAIPPDAVTAALLHDVGKLLMSRFLSPDLLEALHHAEQDAHLTRLDAEIELLGVNHAELGGLIAQCWGLPEGIVRGISYHHHPEEGLEALCYVVCIADVIAKQIGAGADEHADFETFTAAVAELRLGADAVDEIATKSRDRYDDVLARY